MDFTIRIEPRVEPPFRADCLTGDGGVVTVNSDSSSYEAARAALATAWLQSTDRRDLDRATDS